MFDMSRVIRPICSVCNIRACAPNYYRGGVRHWRKKCAYCIKKTKSADPRQKKLPIPKWSIKGYKKKTTCDLCGFKCVYNSQIMVYHIDGNLNNCDLTNLRSICLCCVEVVKRRHFTWKPGAVEPDH